MFFFSINWIHNLLSKIIKIAETFNKNTNNLYPYYLSPQNCCTCFSSVSSSYTKAIYLSFVATATIFIDLLKSLAVVDTPFFLAIPYSLVATRSFGSIVIILN